MARDCCAQPPPCTGNRTETLKHRQGQEGTLYVLFCSRSILPWSILVWSIRWLSRPSSPDRRSDDCQSALRLGRLSVVTVPSSRWFGHRLSPLAGRLNDTLSLSVRPVARPDRLRLSGWLDRLLGWMSLGRRHSPPH